MSNHPTTRGRDRLTVAHGEEHEVREFIDTMRKEFPHIDRNRIESVYARTQQELDPEESRENLRQKVRGELRR